MKILLPETLQISMPNHNAANKSVNLFLFCNAPNTGVAGTLILQAFSSGILIARICIFGLMTSGGIGFVREIIALDIVVSLSFLSFYSSSIFNLHHHHHDFQSLPIGLQTVPEKTARYWPFKVATVIINIIFIRELTMMLKQKKWLM